MGVRSPQRAVGWLCKQRGAAGAGGVLALVGMCERHPAPACSKASKAPTGRTPPCRADARGWPQEGCEHLVRLCTPPFLSQPLRVRFNLPR